MSNLVFFDACQSTFYARDYLTTLWSILTVHVANASWCFCKNIPTYFSNMRGLVCAIHLPSIKCIILDIYGKFLTSNFYFCNVRNIGPYNGLFSCKAIARHLFFVFFRLISLKQVCRRKFTVTFNKCVDDTNTYRF